MKYKPLNGYTKAKIIETIRSKMLDHKSRHESLKYCVYRAHDGNRCAVGVFIPENHDAEISSLSVGELLRNYTGLLQHMPLEMRALRELQIIHDQTPDNCDPRPNLIKWIEDNVEDTA